MHVGGAGLVHWSGWGWSTGMVHTGVHVGGAGLCPLVHGVGGTVSLLMVQVVAGLLMHVHQSKP